MKNKERVLYYSDPVNDDFSKVDFNSKPLPDSYEYIPHNIFRRMIDWFLWHICATPVAYIYTWLVFRQKRVGLEKLKPYKKSGYFLYGNHTRMGGDAFTPGELSFPRKPFIITNNDSASNPFIRFFTKSLGALPLPSSLKGFKEFHKLVVDEAKKGKVITIYPEAHIWPYYTKIRPFKDASFHYPVEANIPIFTFTTTYQKRKHSKMPRATVYIDGPFFPKEDLNKRDNIKYLRDTAYSIMVERSKNSNYEYVKYIYKEKEE